MADIAELVIKIQVKNLDELKAAADSLNKLRKASTDVKDALFREQIQQEKLALAQAKTSTEHNKASVIAQKTANETERLRQSALRLQRQLEGTASTVSRGNRNWSDFFANMLNAREGAAGLLGNMLRLGTGMYLTMRSVETLVKMLIAVPKAMYEVGTEMQTLRINLQALTGDLNSAQYSFGELTKLAREKGVDLGISSDVIARLKGFGVENEKLIPLMQRFIVATRGDAEAMSRLALVFGQVTQQGRTYGDDLRQIYNTGVPIAKALSETLGISSDKLKEAARNGQITAEVLEQAIYKITEEGTALRDAFDRLSEESAILRWKRAIESLKQGFAGLGITIANATTPLAGLLEKVGTGLSGAQAYQEFIKNPSNPDIDLQSALQYAVSLRDSPAETNQLGLPSVSALATKRSSLLSSLGFPSTLGVGEVEDYMASLDKNSRAEILLQSKRKKIYDELLSIDSQIFPVYEAIRKLQERLATKTTEIKPRTWQEIEKASDELLARLFGSSLESFTSAQASLLGGSSAELNNFIANLLATDPTWMAAKDEAKAGNEASLRKLYGELYAGVLEELSSLYRLKPEQIVGGAVFKPSDRSSRELQAMLAYLNTLMEGPKKTGGVEPPKPITGTVTYENPYALRAEGMQEYFRYAYGREPGSLTAMYEKRGASVEDSPEYQYYDKLIKKIEEYDRLVNIVGPESAAILKDLGESLKSQALSSATSTLTDMFKAIGEGTSVADSFGESLVNLMSQLGPLFIEAGLKLIITGTPQGIALGLILIGYGGINIMGSTSSSGKSGYAPVSGAPVYNALGNVYNSPSLSSYSGRAYNSPQFFAFANGAGVFAEAGPEAIMPLARTPSGKLGVESTGGSNVVVQIIDQSSGQVAVSTTETTSSDGTKQIRAVIRDIMKSELASGNMNTSLSSANYLARGRRRV